MVVPIKHFGDITKINGHNVPMVDIITGGSPCQDLSVAGLRKGLQHADLGDAETTRSGLFMDQIRIVKEMRNESRKQLEKSGAVFTVRDIKPRFMVWENVAGAFSSGRPSGGDFQAVLEEICKVVRSECPVVPIPKDGWPSAGNLDGVGDDGTPFSICWRLHDAQYWGVPQRRRRIALIADFGGSSASEILFEPYSLQGNSKQSAKEGQGTPGDTSDSSGETSINGLRESDRRRVEEFLDAVNENAPHQQDLIQSDLGVARTLACGTHASGPHLTKTLVTGNMAVVQGADVYNGELTGEVAASLTTASGISNGGGPKIIGADVYNGDVTGDVAPSVTTKTGEPGSSGPKVIESSDKCLNSWDVQSKHIQPEDGIAESLYAAECRYGGGESYVLQNQKEPVLLESNQNHATIQTDGVSTTLPASMGEGGGYVPMVCQQEPVCMESGQSHACVTTNGISPTLLADAFKQSMPMVCIEGNGSRDSHKGDGYSESETMYTLNTVEQHAVAYGVTAKGNGDVFINPDTHTSLATGGGEPGQGYPCVLATENVPETYQKTTGALMASGYSKLGTQEAANDMYVVQNTPVQSMELFHCTSEEELAAPLKARDYKDPQVIAFEPGAASRVGGHVYTDDTAGTLRAEMGDNQQAVVHSAGFCTEHSAQARGIGYQEETAPTLREGVVPATIYGFDAYNQQETGEVSKSLNSAATDSDHIPCVMESKAVESHAQDARYNVGDVNQTLGANMEHDPSNGGLVYAVDQGGGKSSCNVETDRTPTLTTTHGGEPAVCYGLQGQASDMSVGNDVSPTMISHHVGNVMQSTAFKKSSHAKTSEDGQGWEHTEVNDTLNAFDNGETRTPTLVLNDQGGQQMQVSENQTATLRAEEHGHQPVVLENHPNDSRVKISETGVVQTLSGRMGTGGGNTPMVFENHAQDSRFTNLGETCQTVSATWGMGGNNQPLEVKPQQAVVRRLTPTECTRLQGFPDGWCDIGDWIDSNGKKHKDSDSPKYKALGNSIALPFWDWMAGRMVAQLKNSGVENPTMSSLFDGISGFPYVYIRHGCIPVWTSEIEEYPIAVCKKHFGDEDTGEIGDIDEYLKLPPNWVIKK